jgi:hypothetical protein
MALPSAAGVPPVAGAPPEGLVSVNCQKAPPKGCRIPLKSAYLGSQVECDGSLFAKAFPLAVGLQP